MTWNPRDLSIHQKDPATEDGFRLPPPPGTDPDPFAATNPFLPRATPAMAQVMEWAPDDEVPLVMPQDVRRELEYEGLVDDRAWQNWSRLLMRGHYT